MEDVMQFSENAKEGPYHLFETGEGGNGAQVIVEHNTTLPRARQGYGTGHHAAFRVEERAELDEWQKHLTSFRLPNSGDVERYYCGSLYTNVAPQILCEIATDGTGLMGDEPYETLVEK